MNPKFYSLPKEKRSAIRNAGFHVFSQNTYKKSPMSEIAEGLRRQEFMMDNTQVIEKLKERYGEKEGMRVFMTVMPGITADFHKMLLAAPPGRRVREEYHIDDGKTTIVLTGTRDERGQASVSFSVI